MYCFVVPDEAFFHLGDTLASQCGPLRHWAGKANITVVGSGPVSSVRDLSNFKVRSTLAPRLIRQRFQAACRALCLCDVPPARQLSAALSENLRW